MDAGTVIAGAALGLLGAIGIWLDVFHRRLPNRLCLTVAAVGIAATLMTGSGPQIGSHLLHCLISLIVGMVLFQLALVGGGDAKFYAGVAVWFPMAQAWNLVLTVSLTGLAMLSVWFFWRRLRRIPIRMRSATDADKFPIGVAISAGAMIVFYRAAAG